MQTLLSLPKMMIRASLLACLITTPNLIAQEESAAISPPDGGTRQTLESIFIPPKPNAPFSLTLETEWTRPMGTGGTFTLVNKRHIMRDSSGRIYQERWILVPRGGKIASRMNYIQITDPFDHTLYNCEVSAKHCRLLPYGGSTTTAYQPGLGNTGPLPNGEGSQTHEELGSKDVTGTMTTGFRESITIKAGVLGNDAPMITTREFWYAPQLAINLLSELDSPRSGKQRFTVTELNAVEPDPKYFIVPEGFTVEDRLGQEKPQR